MDTWWYPVLFATGVAAGYVDAIAGGGGLITVPVLMATGLSPADALGTNKLQSACGTTLATMRYARHGLLGQGDWTWGIAATVVGATAGSWCVQQMNPGFLRPLIPILLVTIAIVLITRPDLGSRPGRRVWRRDRLASFSDSCWVFTTASWDREPVHSG